MILWVEGMARAVKVPTFQAGPYPMVLSAQPLESGHFPESTVSHLSFNKRANKRKKKPNSQQFSCQLVLPELNTMFWTNKYIGTLMLLGLFSGSGEG